MPATPTAPAHRTTTPGAHLTPDPASAAAAPYLDWRPFVLLSVVAVLSVEVIVGTMSVLLEGRVTANYLLTGLVASAAVAPASLAVFMRVMRTLARQNERVLAQRLSAAESHLKVALGAADEGILMVADDGAVLAASQRFHELWRVPPELAAHGNDDALLAHVLEQLADPEAFLAEVRRLYRGDEETRDTIRFKDGRVFSRYTRALGSSPGQGRIWCFKDVTSEVRAREELAEREEIYRAIVTQANDAIALIDEATLAFVEFNDVACEGLGYSREEFARLRVPDIQRDLDLSQLRHDSIPVAGSRRSNLETRHRARDGTFRDVSLSVRAIVLRERRFVVATWTDITERKRAEAALARERELSFQREKLAALGSLLAGVAHELNNPLSVVVARAVLLEEQGNLATQTAAAKIRSAAERCARIVRTFLAMARQQPPQRGPVAIEEVVAAALDIANYALRSANIDVQIDLADDLPPIDADADQLHQVLLNLLINAHHALQDVDGPRRVRITGRHEHAAARLLLTVADNGPGIPEALRARVFEPYFTTKPTGVGTGVGLAVSLGIIETHGGTLTVEHASGAGAAFVITLPVAGPDTLRSAARPASLASPGSRTILVVDDEAEVRETLGEILTRAQHRVTMVSSGHEALERLSGQRYDVIFADMRMPGIDGRALYGEIARRWPDQAARVVFVTGDMLTATLSEFIAASGRPLIEKPFLPGDVRRMVGEIAA